MIFRRIFGGDRLALEPGADFPLPAGATECAVASPVPGCARSGLSTAAPVVLDESFTMAHEPSEHGGACCQVHITAGGERVMTVQILKHPRR